MRTYFEPNYNGIDESFSNLVTSTKTVSTLSPKPLISPTLTTTMTSVPKTTATSTLSSPAYSTTVPKITTASSTLSSPTLTNTMTTVPKITTASVPIATTTAVPTLGTAVGQSVSESPIPMGGYGGGGGAIMSGGEEGMTQGEDAFKKTGGINEELIFGFNRNHVYGLGLLALGGFIYFKYIKK